jgi:hypothetical protein
MAEDESLTCTEWSARVAFVMVLFVISIFLFGVDCPTNCADLATVVSTYTLDLIAAAWQDTVITYNFLAEEHSKLMAGELPKCMQH